MRAWYLVCYDVRDDARLRRVQKVLLGYGHRLQYSTFRCRLSERDVERMKWELTKVMDEEDELLVASLCKSCVRKLHVRSSGEGWPVAKPDFEII